MTKNTLEKEHELLELARDHDVSSKLAYIKYNWEVAASRMAMISEERDLGRYDDDGVEAMAVFCRLERVLTTMFALNGRPQATLLRGYREQLKLMIGDNRLNREIAEMMNARTQELTIQAPTIWKRLAAIFHQKKGYTLEDKAIVRELYQKNYLPNMDGEDALKAMEALVNNQEPSDEQQKAQDELMEALVSFGEEIGKVASGSRQLMATGLAMVQAALRVMLVSADLRQKGNAEADALFETARQELLTSDAWKKYWRDHIGHLSQKGSIKTELRHDREEVEQELLDVHRYLYTKMEESAEAFGRALKEADLSDEEMLRLLWLTAKKEAILKETSPVSAERARMEKGVGEAARKLREQAADQYYDHYDDIWDDIVLSEIIASQLMDYSGGIHNDGFNMQVFCHIVGWMQRTYKFYGSNSSVSLGKTLNGGKQSDTFKKYIGALNTILNQQTINELEAIINKERE